MSDDLPIRDINSDEPEEPASDAPAKLTLREKIDSAPTMPGVYQYRDVGGTVIYVGKAKNLRNRTRSYFQEGRPRDAKTTALVRKIVDVEFIVTDSDVEALILEDTLIKKLRPKYNINLKDDKTYPSIRVTNEPYPRVFSTRRIIRDGSRYYGPYTDVGYVRGLLKTLRSIFPIRSCELPLTQSTVNSGRYQVCLDYHIGKCEGPCAAHVTQAEYASMIRQVEQVLKGKTKQLEHAIEEEMEIHAEAMRFERAAALRDRLRKLREYSARQKVVTEDAGDRDFIGIAAEDDDAAAVVLIVRDGRLVGRRQYNVGGVLEQPEEEILRTVVERHYIGVEDVPEEVYLPVELGEEETATVTQMLREKRGGRVSIAVPKIGDKQKLIAMAAANARLMIDELKLQRMKRDEMMPRPVASLQRDLRLAKPPRRIECFDNSNVQGSDPVGAMVCFVDGRPRRSEYRTFKVRTVEGPDDFATMREVVGRRYRRVLNEGLALPDLIVIDGGKGQVSAAMEAIRELKLEHIPLIGLAKRLEEIVIPEQRDTILLPKSSSSLRLLQQIRDEAHKTAVTFHRSVRDRRTLRTELTEIEGIGEKTAKKILELFGSVRGARAASVEELKEKLGAKTGERVHTALHRDAGEGAEMPLDTAALDDIAPGDEPPVIEPI